MSTNEVDTIFDIQAFPIMPKFQHYSFNIIEDFMEKKFPLNFDLYCTLCGIKLKQWQRQECLNLITLYEYLMNWGRGMSKTLLFSLVSVFDALCGLKTVYLVPRTDELVQPMEYFNANPFVDPNPNKKSGDKTFYIEKARWYKVLGRPMIKISNIDDKGFNISSGRFSRVKYDECALLMYYAKEAELLNKADGMMRATLYPHKAYSSTPLVGSQFVTMGDDYKERLPEAYSWRNFENTTDNFLTDTPEKREMIKREKESAIRQGILYAWETENLALPRTASGAAFKNYVEEPFIKFFVKEHKRIGFDFHGFRNGHIWVALGFSVQYPGHVWVVAEGCEKYDEMDNADKSMEFLKIPYFDCELYGEGDIKNMVNGPFLKAGQKWGMQRTRIDGQEKYNLEANILNYNWHIDPAKTPLFYKNFTEAEWADQNKFILHKESAGQKFRNHYIDAAMVALPKIQGRGVYIPNKKLRRSNTYQEHRRVLI